MKIVPRLLVAAVLTLSGCARPDWIEQTLVTVDVTGVWSGELRSRSTSGGTYQSSTVSLKLEQHGPKVTGSFVVSASGATIFQYLAQSRSGPIEGTVAGDVFRFRQTNGPLTGELTVSGDEMAGQGMAIQALSIYLHRVDSPSRPSSQ